MPLPKPLPPSLVDLCDDLPPQPRRYLAQVQKIVIEGNPLDPEYLVLSDAGKESQVNSRDMRRASQHGSDLIVLGALFERQKSATLHAF